MASKRVIQKRVALAALDLRQMKGRITASDWEDAMEWLNNLTGDVEVVREYLQERIDEEKDND